MECGGVRDGGTMLIRLCLIREDNNCLTAMKKKMTTTTTISGGE